MLSLKNNTLIYISCKTNQCWLLIEESFSRQFVKFDRAVHNKYISEGKKRFCKTKNRSKFRSVEPQILQTKHWIKCIFSSLTKK